MYNTQEIANRIKFRAKNCGITMKVMLADLEIGINTVSSLAKGQEMSYLNLAKIADYLDCSVDYLLGRDEKIPSSELSENEKKMLSLFRKLSDVQQERIIERAMTLAESNEPD